MVVDGEIGYTGSLNMVDPRYFKKDAGVGEWVDAMVRIVGPVVEPLAITFLADFVGRETNFIEWFPIGLPLVVLFLPVMAMTTLQK